MTTAFDRRKQRIATRALVAAESQCCAFLDFELARDNGDLVLDIAGPADARAVIDLFFAPEAA